MGGRWLVGTSCMRVHTGMQGGPGLSHSAPLMPLSVPRASCDTARHMRSMCGVLRDDGRERRDGQRRQSHMRRPTKAGRLSRCQRRSDAMRARRRQNNGVLGACGAAVLMVLMVQRASCSRRTAC